MRAGRRMVGLWVGALLLGMPGLAGAARLVKQEENLTRHATPGESRAPNGPCRIDSSATSSAGIEVGGRSAFVSASGEGSVQAMTTDCDEALAQGQGQALALFSIQPTAGENPGDEVLVCLVSSFRVSAFNSSPLFKTSGQIGPSAASLVRDPFGVAQTLYSFGPVLLSGGDPPIRESGRQRFVVQIGDTLALQVEANGEAARPAETIGSARGSAAGSLKLYVGDCPSQPAPVVSPVGLPLLGLLLAAGGGLALARRSVRQLSDV